MLKKEWDKRHKESGYRFLRTTKFAKHIYFNYLEDMRGKLLDLGCGKGADAMFFTYKGFKVTALDFSEEAIKFFNSVQKKKGLSITTLVRDMRDDFIFEDESYDIVYARSSLYYFNDEETKKIFSEIDRVLKSEGLVIFQVKSTSDKNFGHGEEIETNMFKDDEGYPRHYFSKEYSQELLPDYDFIVLEDRKIYNGAAYLNVIARKP